MDTSLWNWYLYFQDTWQVSDKLTLNLGLRYDYDNSVKAGNEYVDQKNAQLVARYGGLPPLSKAKADTNNLAPRLGVVYTPGRDKRTTLRARPAGGSSTRTTTTSTRSTTPTPCSPTSSSSFDANDPFSPSPFGGSDQLRKFLAEGFPYFPDLTLAPAPSDIINRNDPNLKVSYTDQVTGGVSHDFGHGLVPTPTTSTRAARHPLYVEENIAIVNGEYIQPDPRFATIGTLKNVGTSKYNALPHLRCATTRRREAPTSRTRSRRPPRTTAPTSSAPAHQPLDLSEDEGPDITIAATTSWSTATTPSPGTSSSPASGPVGARRPTAYHPRSNCDPDDPFIRSARTANSRRGDSFNTVDLRPPRRLRWAAARGVSVFWEVYNVLNTDNFQGYVTRRESHTFGLPTAAFEKRRQQGGVRIDF